VQVGAVLPFGDSAFVVTTQDAWDAATLAAGLRASLTPGIIEVVGALRSVLVVWDPNRVPSLSSAQEMIEAIAAREPTGAALGEHRNITVPVCFDGPDLESVAQQCNMDVADVVDLVLGTLFRVVTLGFSPGFAYLDGLQGPLVDVPRRPTPRTSVPAGSLAIAGGYAAIYPQATPGGWQLLGRTPTRFFDAARPPFALVGPGDQVRFTALGSAPSGSASTDVGEDPVAPDGPVALLVESPGILSLIQDPGRIGLSHLGVPRGGPANPIASRLANRLVGNSDDAGVLEVTARGPILQCLRPTYVGVCGAPCDVRIDGRPVPMSQVVPLDSGQRLAIGEVGPGLRTYVGVAGGLQRAPVMGSLATDTLSWIGPGPLRRGDRLATGEIGGPIHDHLSLRAVQLAAGRFEESWSRGAATLRVVGGPHTPWFSANVLEDLTSRQFLVQGASDRVGVRLNVIDGEGLERRPGQLESQGMLTGAVQVPPDGQPVILQIDHATMGGYPVAAVVISSDLTVLSQLAPGDRVRFEVVTLEEAHAIRRRVDQFVDGGVLGSYPVVAGT
jgi:KipI family sensor histidine kinase inhibitor